MIRRCPSLSAAGLRGVPSGPVGSVRPLVPLRVRGLCVGAGVPVPAPRGVRRIPDERPGVPAHGAVRLLRAGLQTHVHTGG